MCAMQTCLSHALGLLASCLCLLNVLSVSLQRKFEGVADRLNDEFYHKDPKSYPFKRESEECYNKWRSLKATWTKEVAKACKHKLSSSETGNPQMVQTCFRPSGICMLFGMSVVSKATRQTRMNRQAQT